MLNPDRVELVRLRLGLTKSGFADRLRIDRKTLLRFETGLFSFPESALQKLCALSGYPRAFFDKGPFQLPSADGVSFRSLRSLTAGSRDAALAAGALAFEFDDWISARYGLPEQQVPQCENQAPEQAAAFVRARWGIGERPIGNIINLLEARGVRVFSLTEETRHLDAYSFWRDDQPYIFLNTLKTAERTRFDAAHELGHLVMHRQTVGGAYANMEIEANAFASAFLMPPADLKAELPHVRSLDDIIKAKGRWGVSALALNYALNKIGCVSDWHYRQYTIALGQMGEREPSPMPRETSQVWTKILTDLWRQGMSVSRIAEELLIPEFELSSLLFGIASMQQPGAPPLARAPLRLISDA
jgi:Zn-dependent peptidase ImmA (M78 family)